MTFSLPQHLLLSLLCTLPLLLPAQVDWTADWLRYPLPDENTADTLYLPPATYFRRPFAVDKPVARATLHATALGLFEARLNGRPVTEDRFTPGWSDYTKRIYYLSYDVTGQLSRDENILTAVLADGWYAGYVGPKELSNPRNRELYGTEPAFRAQLEIEYTDGTTQLIETDENWQASGGPLTYADLLMGEVYDATKPFDWARPRVQRSVEEEQGGAELLEYPGEPVRAYAEITPRNVRRLPDGKYLFDLGQNFAGHARLTVRGRRGDTITLRFGEMLNPDGSLMTENLRFARATDKYILHGAGTETWAPRFTYQGFRYVEVAGLRAAPDTSTITGIAVSASTPLIGRFQSSDSLLNRLHRNIVWTQRSNMIEVPTDSPQRDERLGWLGDAQFFSRSALYNADLRKFYAKWFADLRDAQYDFGAYANFAPRPYPDLVWYSPGWMEAGLIVPHNAWLFTGDTSLIRDHYSSMRRYMDFVIAKSKPTGYIYPENSWTEIGPHGGFGDWLSLTDKHVGHDLMASMYLLHSFTMMAEMSRILGHPAQSSEYLHLRDVARKNFVEHYVAADGKFAIDESAYGDGKGYFEGNKGFTGHTQSAYATAIYFGILPDSLRLAAARHLTDLVLAADGKPTSGILGIRQLLPALTMIDRADLAYAMLLNEDYPGWGFQIANGATTIWERWNSYTLEKGFNGEMNSKMNSFNHYAFGAVGQFLYGNLAGIRPGSPGFRKIIFHPEPGTGRVQSVSADYTAPTGNIHSSWAWTKNELKLTFTVPPGTTAEAHVPFPAGLRPVTSPGLKRLRNTPTRATYLLPPGTHHFTTTPPPDVEDVQKQ